MRESEVKKREEMGNMDPLAEENYGPTEDLHVTFLYSGPPRQQQKKLHVSLDGHKKRHNAESKQSQEAGDACSGPAHVAHPWRSSPLMLDVWLEVCAQTVWEVEAQSGSH
ncbi:unnamed protein product [Pleuronectes platessa]|uniref:Uncharacterized protein n=1 Tax=Pleuronectes platessa TaxID=8262 RepID=A0A9N7Z2Q0_PLEPL|nr:unnamed protein product [Pleuronectes platessa]